jgi:hypothetical protein
MVTVISASVTKRVPRVIGAGSVSNSMRLSMVLPRRNRQSGRIKVSLVAAPAAEERMTRSAIAEELWSLLNEEPQKKQDVVHVLIQIRKVLEHDGKPAKFEGLKFFCDWVAHPKLAGTGAREVLRMLDQQLPTLYGNPEDVDPQGVVHTILSFDLLRRELSAFLSAAENDFPTRWVEDDFAWKIVVQFYGQQVQNSPLVIDNDKHALSYIRRVEIVACEPVKHVVEANPTEKYYGFKWVVTLNSGKTFSWPYTSNQPDRPANWPTQGVRASR